MQWFFSGVGIGCLLFGAHLAVKTRIQEFRDPPPPPPQSGTVRKVERDHGANWGAAEGFAMAGGLCLIAAALVHRDRPSRLPGNTRRLVLVRSQPREGGPPGAPREPATSHRAGRPIRQ